MIRKNKTEPLNMKLSIWQASIFQYSYPPWSQQQTPLKLGHPKRKFIFQPSIFKGYMAMLPSGRVFLSHISGPSAHRRQRRFLRFCRHSISHSRSLTPRGHRQWVNKLGISSFSVFVGGDFYGLPLRICNDPLETCTKSTLTNLSVMG